MRFQNELAPASDPAEDTRSSHQTALGEQSHSVTAGHIAAPAAAISFACASRPRIRRASYRGPCVSSPRKYTAAIPATRPGPDRPAQFLPTIAEPPRRSLCLAGSGRPLLRLRFLSPDGQAWPRFALSALQPSPVRRLPGPEARSASAPPTPQPTILRLNSNAAQIPPASSPAAAAVTPSRLPRRGARLRSPQPSAHLPGCPSLPLLLPCSRSTEATA
jgi:hypothetical protein